MKKYLTLKHIAWAGAGIFLIYSLLGFVAIPFAAKKLIVRSLDSLPGCRGNIGGMSFNPYTLEAGLEALEITENQDAPLFRLKGLYINLSAVSLFKLAPVITQLELDSPQAFLTLTKEGQLNITSLFERAPATAGDGAAETKQTDSESRGLAFRLSDLLIREGSVHFTDQIRGSKQVVDGLNLSLPRLSSLKGEQDTRAEPVLHLKLNGALVEIRLASLPFKPGLDTRIELSAKQVDLAAALPYLDLPRDLLVRSAGRLDLDLTGTYRMDPETPHLHTLGADLSLVLTAIDMATQLAGQGGERPLFACPKLVVDADTKDLLSGKFQVKQARLYEPRLDLERDETGRLGLMTLFARDGAAPPPDGADQQKSPSADSPARFQIRLADAGLSNAQIRFKDRSVTPAFETRLSQLELGFNQMEIGPKGIISGAYTVGFQTESNERFSTRGQLATTPALEVTGRLDAGDILPEKYRPYYAPYGGQGLTLETIGLGSEFKFKIQDNDPEVSTQGGQITLKGLRIRGEADAGPVVDIKSIDCSGIAVDSNLRRIRVKQAVADSGALALVRDGAGQINLVQRIGQMVSVDAAGNGAGNGSGKSAPAEGQGAEPAIPWLFTLDRFDLKNYALSFSDLVPADPVQINARDIHIFAEQLTTEPGKQGEVGADLMLGKTGGVSVKGGLDLSGPTAVLDLAVEKIPLTTFQPYFTDHLNILLDKGNGETRGRLWAGLGKSGQPDIRFKGTAAVTDFVSKTKSDGHDFFKCNSLYLSGIDFELSPMGVDIEKIALTDFYQKTLISKSGQLNLGAIVKSDQLADPADEGHTVGKSEGQSNTGPSRNKTAGQAEASMGSGPTGAAPPAAAPIINIGAVTLQGGHINFTDLHTPPGFVANMTQVGGSVTGLSSLPDKKPAQLLLKGTHSRHAPLDISGTIDPLKKAPFADLAISFKNIELPEFNAYTEKFLGYPIEKGKLILDLKYKIDRDRLASSNHIFFDQLTLGPRVESEHAVSLPIELAISLLKDANGQIKLDVPIRGNLKDPKFSFGDVVATALKNMILGVVTAPFKFLGALVGLAEGEDLGSVAFLPGSQVLSEAAIAKIDQLAQILVEKENLKLEIEGTYHPEKDGNSLRQLKYTGLLADLQAELHLAPEKALDQLTAEEYQRLVAAAYEEGQFPKPKDESGNEKALPPEEKEKLLITAIPVEKEALKQLAVQRSDTIREQMVQGGIDPGRIFVKDPVAVSEAQAGDTEVNTLFKLK